MTNTTNDKQADQQRREAWRRTALAVALVAAAFSAMVIGVMVATYMDEPADDQTGSSLLTTLREQLANRPNDEQLKSDIRDLDLAVQARYFRYRKRLETGALMLLVGLVVLVGALRWRAALEPRMPTVVRRADMPEPEAVRWTPARQNAVAIGVVAVALAATLWILGRASPDVGAQPASKPGASPKTDVVKEPIPEGPEAFAKYWPQFRGPTGMGIVPAGKWPTAWNGQAGENVVWKTPIPLPGNSSPVVWGDRVYVTAATIDKRVVYGIDRGTGKILWTANVPTRMRGKMEEVFEETGYAAPSPATNGHYVLALFATADLVCLDHTGKIVWQEWLGPPESMYGLASSLVLYKSTVIVQFDRGAEAGDGLSAIKAFDIAKGDLLWESPRDVANSWSTPVVVNTGTREALVTCSKPRVIAYEPDSGVELWRANVLDGDVAPMPVFAGGRIFVTNEGARLSAIKPGGAGDVTGTHMAWTADEGMPDTASPVANEKWFLQAHGGGLVTCFDAATGKKAWEHYFDGGFKGSPALVGELVYLPSDEGKTYIFPLGPTFELKHTATLGEKRHASTAFVESRLYIRGRKNLYCIGADK